MSAGATPGGTAAYRDTLRELPATHFRTLVGMSQREHVRENLAVARIAPAPEAAHGLFRPA